MDKLLNLINQEYVSNIYIGITSILVAVVIFIAEVIKDQNNELNKKVILSKTGIKKNSIFLLSIFFYMLIINMFRFDETNQINSLNNIIYLLTHILLILLVFASIFTTGAVFIIAIKLNTEKDYFNRALEEDYIYKKTPKLEKRALKKTNKKSKKEDKEFREYINSQKIVFSDKSKIKDFSKYIAIYPVKNGIVGNFNYKKLNDYIDYLKNNRVNKEKYDGIDRNIIYIPNSIGKIVNKKEPIFYCLKEYKNIFKNLGDIIVYRDNRLFINDEIKLINKCLFELASNYEEPDYFDENSRLYNYFKYLYDKRLYGIKSLALDNIEEMYRKSYNVFSKNRQFCHFLNTLSSLAYCYDEYEDYAYVNKYKLYLYINQLENKAVNTKQIAYNFINNAIRFDLYSAKKNSDIRYYDYLLSMILNFIVILIKKNDYEAIEVIFDNLLIGRINYSDNEFDEIDIINFQFTIGIIYALYIAFKKYKIEEKSIKIIENIINYIQNHLIYLWDAWNTIKVFREYFDKKSAVQEVYSKFDFEFSNYEYKTSVSGWTIDSKIILKELLFAMKIEFVNFGEIDKDTIIKDDEYFYSGLLKIINDDDNTKLDLGLQIKYNKENVVKALTVAIEEAKKKEREYNRVNDLNNDKLLKFEKLVREKTETENQLVNQLRRFDKVKESNQKLKNVLGINQLIPRNLFFDNVGGYDYIADSYCNAIERGIEKEFIKKIKKVSVKNTLDLKATIGTIEDTSNYVIVLNTFKSSLQQSIIYDNNIKFLKIKDKKIQIIEVPETNDIYLLKIEDIPIIEFCGFDKDFEEENIFGNTYLEIIDCSKDKKIREKIIKESDWLKEKGNESEQDNYLRELCRFRLFRSFKINTKFSSNIIEFNEAQD